VIHKVLNLTRPLFVVDTETTGLDVKNDRIAEFGFQEWVGAGPCKNCENQLTAFKSGSIAELPKTCEFCNMTGRIEGGMIKEWRTLVNPGVPIPPSVTKIHGITDEMVRGCRLCSRSAAYHDLEEAVDDMGQRCTGFKPWPRFADLAESLATGLSNCDFGGQNPRFDLRITSSEMSRSGVTWSYAGARIVDSRQLEQIAVPRHLGDLHKKYTGHKHDGAHGALSDVRAAATVIFHQLQTYPELPRDLDVLHAAQWPGMIDPDGKFAFVDGVACFGRWGKYAGKPMKVADPGYWDFILKNDFSPEAKAIAADAKLGKFPEQKR
jgi:DNA polymerase-3 subunit epsilon